MPSPEKLPVSPFSEAYERLLANGYSVLPISPHSKAPSEHRGGKWRPMNEWQRYRDTPASGFILRAWAGWPDGNIGILTGTRATATHIVACVDYDSDDPDVLLELQRAIPASPVMKRGKRGFSAFYLVPNGTEGFRTAVVELLTDTRQTVIPPSIHPDTGRAYQWTGTATLLDTPAAALPVLTDDDLARFRDTVEALTQRPIGQGAHVVRFPHGEPLPDGEKSPWRLMNERALLNLDAWVPELGLPKLQRTGQGYKGVAYWRMSSTGRSLEQRAPNLSMTPAGIRDFGSGSSYTALDLVQVVFALDLEDAFRWLGARVGGLEAEGFPPEAPSSPAVAAAALPAHDPETGEILETADMGIPVSGRGDEELPDELTRLPGLLGEMVEWICRASSRPNRVLALGAAISVMASVVGKGLAGPQNRNSPHLYVLAMAPSGVGKDGPLKAIGKLLKGSNLSDRIGPSEFMSMSAVINYLADRRMRPVSTCAMDEFGAYLRRILSRKAGTHETGIVKPLLQLWSCNHDDYQTPQWAGTASTMIESPAITIYGTSTPENFFAALSNDDTSNGFLNRFLLLSTEYKPPENENVLQAIPDELRVGLADLRSWAEAIPAGVRDPDYLREMRWGTGWPLYQAFRDRMEERQANHAQGNYYARTAEIAIRLAMIRAAGQRRMELHGEDMQWGIEVAEWSSDKLAELAELHMAGSLQKERHNRLVQWLRKRGSATRAEIYKGAFHSELNKRELTEVLDSMVDGGTLEKSALTPVETGQRRGPAPEIYRLVR